MIYRAMVLYERTVPIIIYDLSLLIVLKAKLEQMLFENEKIVLYLNTVKLQPTNI